jgi:competence protein ComEC
VHDDVPAALPLIAFGGALALAPMLESRLEAIAALVAIAIIALSRRHRSAAPIAFAAFGLIAGHRLIEQRAAELRTFRTIPQARFVTIEAPLDREWSRRGHVYVLRSTAFVANGSHFRAPVAIYARFTPPPIGLEATVRAEGFLRLDERGRYTVSVKSKRLLTYAGRVSLLWPATWNRLLSQRIRPYAATRPHDIAMIEALALGRGERLDEETRNEYRRGGTYHLLVFSGLQIALAATLIALLLRWTGHARISDWCLLAFAVIAPLFIGPTASVSRASIGIALYAISRIAGRPTSFENLWCVAAMLRLAFAPADLTDPAFHLTYAGAGALIFIGKPLARTRLRWFSYAIAAELAVVPLTLFHFHQYALGGSIATTLLTPLIFVQLLAGSAFALVRAIVLLDVVGWLNVGAGWINSGAAPASGFFAAPPATALMVGYGGAIAALAFARGRPRVVMMLASLLIADCAAIVVHRRARTVSAPTITFLDVGQGDSVLLRSGDRAALVDGGGRSDDTRFGDAVLLPLLVQRGIRTLEFVVLTHAHPDHCGGLPAVLRELDVRALWITPQRFRGECAHRLLEAATDSGTMVRLLKRTTGKQVGEMTVVLQPPYRRYRRAPENNSSVLVRAHANGRSVLLTGDIERDAESDAADHIHSRLDVMKIAHHGSRTSTTKALLDAANPRVAVVSCGRNNLFGHPHPLVVQALAKKGIRLWRTDRSGTIDVTLGRTLTVTPQIDTP